MRMLHIGVGVSAVMLAGLLGPLEGSAFAQSASTDAAPPGDSKTFAQSSTDTTAPTGRKPTAAPDAPAPAPGGAVANPAPPPPQSPFAAVTDIGQQLKTRGIYLQLGYIENVIADISGGRKRGALGLGELYFGGVLDLQTLAGIPEASFHITFDERNGYNPGSQAGTQGPLAANNGPTRTTRLSEFYWEQGFLKDRIDIIAGRTNPTADFATSLIACNYVSSIICAQPGSWYFNNNNAAYPASNWGARANFAPIPDWYIRAGVYDDNTHVFQGKDYGFNWFNEQGHTGVFVPVEIGYSTDFTSARFPAKYDVGAYVDAATYGTPAGQERNTRTAWWVQGQQAVWRPDPATTRSLTLLAGAIAYQGGGPYWTQAYAGAVARAPIASRPNDTFNFIASYFSQNSAFQPSHSDEWIFEANYGFSIIPGITLKPVAQYVIRPNEIGFAPKRRPGDAVLVGVQFSIDAGTVLKFPQFVPY